MTDKTTLLVPIRYPLNDESARTLAIASRVATQQAPADVLVLHVNLFQTNGNKQTEELTHAISAVLDNVEATVITRREFFVEETILAEADEVNADVIVVGADRKAMWRRVIRRFIGGEPAVGLYPHTHTTEDTEIIEVDNMTSIPEAES